MDVNQEILKSFLDHKTNLLNIHMQMIEHSTKCFDGSCDCIKVVEMDELVVANSETMRLDLRKLDGEKRDLCFNALNVCTVMNDIIWFKKLLANTEPESKADA